jgi:hypothetical protein
MVSCKDCGLLQLNYTVPKEVMFKNHGYRSGMTQTLKDHFHAIAKENIEMFDLGWNDLIVDIGGNDGTQLLEYRALGCDNVMNVESADNIAKISWEAGIPTINDYFNEDTVLREFELKSAKLVNAAGVFFHLEELHSVCRGLAWLLAEDGVFNVQCMYAGEMVKQGTFDMIYHEHLCFYTLRSLEKLLEPYGLRVFDAYHSPIHSGSLIVRACQGNTYEYTDRYKQMLAEDQQYGREDFDLFAERINANRGQLRRFLSHLKSEGKTIYAYGAPAKGNTLLNYERIDNTLIDKAVEINKLKVGKVLPMSNIPVEEESAEDRPDYYLLLSHNFEEEIIRRNRELLNKGTKFIVPFPHLHVIGDNE